MDLEDKLRHERIRGVKEGIEQERREGMLEGEGHIIGLFQVMTATGADKDALNRVLNDSEFREQMYAKYNIR